MPDRIDPFLAVIRAKLLTLKAVGDDGFEGLVAAAAAEVSGLTFRLAKGGAQFGRDALALAEGFGVAIEAKLYHDSVPLQELAGKATLATFALQGQTDVWGDSAARVPWATTSL